VGTRLDDPLWRAVSLALARATGKPSRIDRVERCAGGCINAAAVIHLADGRRYFLKWNAAAPPAVFEREAEGLSALRRAAGGTLRVPEVVATHDALSPTEGDGVPSFLLLEHVTAGPTGAKFFEEFGRAFATMHRTSSGASAGFDHDNYLGSTPQPNGWRDDWVVFWREQRLEHQLSLARRDGHDTPELMSLADRLVLRLGDFLTLREEPMCLLHGDLWGGNFLGDDAGRAALIDPACYRGHREADLAMTKLFGGFPGTFYRAYEEAWPLPPGSEVRVEIYKLYHLLNHLHLFGTGYLGQCIETMRRLVG